MEMAGASLRFFCSSLLCKASSSTSFFCTFFNGCDRRQFQVKYSFLTLIRIIVAINWKRCGNGIGFWVAANLCPFLWKNIVALLLYPFLWTWTIISTLWFMSARSWVLFDMIQVPDWAIEAAGQEMRAMDQDADAYHPGVYLTPAQVTSTKERSSGDTYSGTSKVQAEGCPN